jgi:hypothetical protein
MLIHDRRRSFPNSRGFGVGGEEVMQRHALESEFGRAGVGLGVGLLGNVWKFLCFLAAYLSYEISCFWAFRDFHMRFHAF